MSSTQTPQITESLPEDILYSLKDIFPDKVRLNCEDEVYSILKKWFIFKYPLLSLAKTDSKYHIAVYSKKHREKIKTAVLQSAKESGLEDSVIFLN